MAARQGCQCAGQVTDLGAAVANAQPAAVFLQHVHACPAVGSIDHQIQGAVDIQNRPQRAQPGLRIGQVVQHAGADDQVEDLAQLLHLFNWHAENIEI